MQTSAATFTYTKQRQNLSTYLELTILTISTGPLRVFKFFQGIWQKRRLTQELALMQPSSSDLNQLSYLKTLCNSLKIAQLFHLFLKINTGYDDIRLHYINDHDIIVNRAMIFHTLTSFTYSFFFRCKNFAFQDWHSLNQLIRTHFLPSQGARVENPMAMHALWL